MLGVIALNNKNYINIYKRGDSQYIYIIYMFTKETVVSGHHRTKAIKNMITMIVQ